MSVQDGCPPTIIDGPCGLPAHGVWHKSSSLRDGYRIRHGKWARSLYEGQPVFQDEAGKAVKRWGQDLQLILRMAGAMVVSVRRA
jgi:hypothetical protein